MIQRPVKVDDDEKIITVIGHGRSIMSPPAQGEETSPLP